MWVITKTIKKGDYLYAVVKDNPNATKYGYVLYHRIVMENHLGRVLTADEVVHHIDGDKFNNDISNLRLMSNDEHVKLHSSSRGRKFVILKCPECGKVFELDHRNSFLSKKTPATFCSRSCSGKFNYKKSSNGLTPEMESAMAGNLIKVFVKYTDQDC